MTNTEINSQGEYSSQMVPPAATGPQAWYSVDMARQEESWNHTWTAAEVNEIEAAVKSVEDQGLEILQIGEADFQLPKLTTRLLQIRNHVLHGPGLFLLRGLPIENWSFKQAAIAFWGLGINLREPCSQNGKGHVLGHVKNLGLNYDNPQVRGYQTSARLAYHTDSSDIVGLFCWRPSKSGGASSVASSTTVYNEIRQKRPDLLQVLMQPFQRTRWGEIPEGKKAFAEVPIFMPAGGRIIAHYVRSAIRKGQALPGVRALSTKQIEALDLIDELAADPAIHLDMEFQPGDIQLICNHSLFHGRTAFEDFPEASMRRHLIRLWLACEDGPDLPDWLLNSYEGKTKNGRPNGIVVSGVPFNAPLQAE